MILEQDHLEHYGILRRSGRYPWGSGETQAARNQSFLQTIDGLKKQGVPLNEILKGYGITTTDYRKARTIAVNEIRQDKINQAARLREKGVGYSEIGRIMGGIPESSVRSLLEPSRRDKTLVLQTTANLLRDEVKKKKYLDVGSGNEYKLGITQNKLNTALSILQEQGYPVHVVDIRALGTGKLTKTKVLTLPGISKAEVNQNKGQIQLIGAYSKDGGRSALGILPPLSISSKRIGVRYAEDGGGDADGVIFVRPNIKDVDIGGNLYAQVRIAVDGSHYLKGMAIYKDDLPAGKDLVFNTNKPRTDNIHDVMKPLKDDPDNPFGASIQRQITQKDAKGNDYLTSSMNIVNEAGSWEKWRKGIASQVLSKQRPELAEAQLAMEFERRRNDLDEIKALTHPAVRRKLLDTFADETDSAAVYLRAAALPRQASFAILPSKSMRENEIYAPGGPGFHNGDRVVLIRYPHAGTFEIPELTVNNRNVAARTMIGRATDAVVIHPSVAQRLSGADFDGDTVLVIKNNTGTIKWTPALEGLKDFDCRAAYPPYDGMRTIDGGTWDAKTRTVNYGGRKPNGALKQQEMGKITNLITDMTIYGAQPDEVVRAVRHSMVVIDSENHHLNWKASARDNGITALKTKYQGGPTAGARTLISKARSKTFVNARRERYTSRGGPIDLATGRKMYEPTGATYINKKTGERVPRRFESKKLAETEDAYTLVSSPGTQMERIYADHSNRLKALANEARKELAFTKSVPYSPSAAKIYSDQVATLNSSLNLIKANRPYERNAQAIAGATYAAIRRNNPDMSKSDLKKMRQQALNAARARLGYKPLHVPISQEEWNAIQAGAISNNKLEQILEKADIKIVRQLATPRARLIMSTSKVSRAKSMLASGYTQAEVADHLGVSLSTLKRSLSEGAS